VSGKIITRVREREQRMLYRRWIVWETTPEPSLLSLTWGMLKNWRQWFFKDGRDGGM